METLSMEKHLRTFHQDSVVRLLAAPGRTPVIFRNERTLQLVLVHLVLHKQRQRFWPWVVFNGRGMGPAYVLQDVGRQAFSDKVHPPRAAA